MDNFLIAFLLTLIAGLCTGIGSCIAFLPNIPTGNFSLSVWDLQQVL